MDNSVSGALLSGLLFPSLNFSSGSYEDSTPPCVKWVNILLHPWLSEALIPEVLIQGSELLSWKMLRRNEVTLTRQSPWQLCFPIPYLLKLPCWKPSKFVQIEEIFLLELPELCWRRGLRYKASFAQGRDSLWGGRKTPQPPEIDAYCGVVTARGPQSSCQGWRRIWAAHATPEGAHAFVLAFLSPDHLEVTGRSRKISFLPG